MTKKMVCVAVGTPKVVTDDRGQKVIRLYPDVHIDPEQSVSTLIERLKECQDEYGDKYADLHIDAREDCGCRYECWCRPSYVLCGTREETDIEYEIRVEREESAKKVEEERARREFEKLKERFGE